MSWEALAAAKSLPISSVNATEKFVLFVLAYHHNDETDQCNPSLKTIQAETNLAKSTIIRAIDSLERKEVIVVAREKDDRGNVSNQYSLLFLRYPLVAPRDYPSSATLPEQKVNSIPPTTTTLRRVSVVGPPQGMEEFHEIISDGLPGYKPTNDFWATVERYRAGLDLVDEAHRMAVWFADHPNKRKGTNSFILNWLQRSGQKLVRTANEQRAPPLSLRVETRPEVLAYYDRMSGAS